MPHASTHPVLSAWLGDPATASHLTWEAEAAALLRFWRALAEASAEAGALPEAQARALLDALRPGLLPAPAELADRMRRDGVVVPGLVDVLRARLPEAARPALHNGATSQDALDTALCLRLRPLLVEHATRLGALDGMLAGLGDRFGDRPLMTVTRLRDALPSTVGARVAAWRAGLGPAAAGLRAAAGALPVQLGGPVGDLRGLGAAGPAVRAGLAARLGLVDSGHAWHVDRGRLMAAAAALETGARAAAKPALDLGLMAQDRIGAARLSGGASSAMAHKVNPVDAELAPAMARHTAHLLGAMAASCLHELERSGMAWTGEWLALPDIALAAGGALAAAERLSVAVEQLGERD